MVSIRARTEAAEERSGTATFALIFCTRAAVASEGEQLTPPFRILASTHFEPTTARMAFPCFDEPSFKANFSVRIRRTSGYISLSNMPVVSVVRSVVCVRMCVWRKTNQPGIIGEFQASTVEVRSGLFEDQFQASVKMSTYLLAFIVCDFKSVTATTSSGVQVFSLKTLLSAV